MGFKRWWWNWRRGYLYSHRKVKRRARKDGRGWRWTIWPFREEKQPVPALEQQTAADFERELKEAAQADLATIAKWWEEDDEELRSDYCDAYEEYLLARDAEERETAEATEARKAYELAKEAYYQFDPPALDQRWMYFWLALIGLGEFFLNSTVFQILGGGRWETYLAALAIGVAIPIFGHWTGHKLRQEEKARSDWVLLGLTPAALFAGLYGLALLRGEFARAAGEQIQRVFGVQFSNEEFLMIFLLLNILLFFVATICSYAASHPRAESYRNARKQFEAAKGELEKESAEAKAAANRLELARKRYQKARNRRQQRYEIRRQEALDQRRDYEFYCQVYRAENIRSRSDGRPDCFDLDIPAASVKLPDVLRPAELRDWECPDLSVEAARVARGEPEAAESLPHAEAQV